MNTTVKGMRDFYGEELEKHRRIIETAKRVFESYGYGELDTPALETEETLSKKAGEEIKGQLFRIEGGLAMRFDLTVPLARHVAQGNYAKPFKRYAIGKVWRREEPQKGRFREFYQADADVVGSNSQRCEAELLAIALQVLRELGFKGLTIKLNDRAVLNGIAEKFGVEGKERGRLFRALDKIGKVHKSASEAIRAAGIDSPKLEAFYGKINGAGNGKTIKAVGELLGDESIAGIQRIIEYSEPYGIAKDIAIDVSLVRGLEYYTGPIFEITSEEYQLSIAGGGRYDGLVGLYGQNEPAVGISLGIERIASLLAGPKEGRKTAIVVNIGDELHSDALAIAKELRKKIACETDLMGRNLSKQLQYANSKGFDYAIIIGPGEKEKGVVKVKDLKTGKEKEVKYGKLAEEF